MDLESIPRPDRDTCNQLAGLTGLGWTTSTLGFLSTIVGYGNGLVSRLATDPQSLLYLGVLFFLTTLGLDRLANAPADEASEPEQPSNTEA